MPPRSQTKRKALSAFPFPDFRDYQRDILLEAAAALFDEDYETVVIDAPTGIGKSAINTTLCRMADSAFMTTPEKKLRKQLENDGTLARHYAVLRSRSDYTCDYASSPRERVSCSDCEINIADDEHCSHVDACTYWSDKETAMSQSVATLTFAYLIVDNYLPRFSEEGKRDAPISFGNRDLLVVDEAHQLEPQTASLFAGFTISPNTLPETVYGAPREPLEDEFDEITDATRYEEIESVLDDLYERVQLFLEKRANMPKHRLENDRQLRRDIRQCQNMRRRMKYCREEIEEGRDWITNVEIMGEDDDENNPARIQLKPVKVDRFLDEYVWSRASSQVLSTATMPFRGNPERWLLSLGLNPEKTRIISRPMPFDVENRRIRTDTAIGKFSRGRYNDHWETIVDRIDLLSRRHDGEKGLIHTASYDLAERLYESFQHNAVLHERDAPKADDWFIQQWQTTDQQLFFSPAVMDGIDLEGDMCRWQALLKVPYPFLGDSRVEYMVDEQNDWDWYYEQAVRRLIQSVGRGVRSNEDYCDYYVLDESFLDVMESAAVPDWFQEAIV